MEKTRGIPKQVKSIHCEVMPVKVPKVVEQGQANLLVLSGTLIHKGGFWPRLPPPGACIRGMAKDETKEETAFSEGVVYFSWNNVEISMAN